MTPNFCTQGNKLIQDYFEDSNTNWRNCKKVVIIISARDEQVIQRYMWQKLAKTWEKLESGWFLNLFPLKDQEINSLMVLIFSHQYNFRNCVYKLLNTCILLICYVIIHLIKALTIDFKGSLNSQLILSDRISHRYPCRFDSFDEFSEIFSAVAWHQPNSIEYDPIPRVTFSE
jgi:hypothetical protein